MLNTLTPGMRVHVDTLPYRHGLAATGTALVLAVHPRTAHIRYQRRRDGRIITRWIKRTRLELAA